VVRLVRRFHCLFFFESLLRALLLVLLSLLPFHVSRALFLSAFSAFNIGIV
jgi:hypothetical protein